jgi:hypothetical protein
MGIKDFFKSKWRKEAEAKQSALEKKLDLLISDNSNGMLDRIELEKEKELIRKVSQRDSSGEVKDYLDDLVVDSSIYNRRAIAMADASEAVERYGFKKFDPNIEEGIPASVITIDEYRKNPGKYIHKLKQGPLSFPLNLNFNNLRTNNFSNFDLNHSNIEFHPTSTFLGYTKGDSEDVIRGAMELSRLNGNSSRTGYIKLDTMDYLANVDGLMGYVSENKELSSSKKEASMKMLQYGKAVYVTAFELIGTSMICDTSDLLRYDSKTHSETSPVKQESNLKSAIRASLLDNMSGMTRVDADNYLTIRNINTFRKLANERTLEILANDKKHGGLTDTIHKPLEDYSIGESLVLSCYFARNIIKNYEKPEDVAKRLLFGKDSEEITGKCSDYAGLAVQYLNEYLVPLNSKKFEGWKFGFETEHIGNSWDHVYMKAIHENNDGTFDIYYADPTQLADIGIDALKTPKDIAKYTDSMSRPLEIKRDAEDLLYNSLKED